MKLVGVLLAASALLAAGEGPKVTFIKSFKGAMPPYYSVEVNRDGSGVYKEAPDDPQPVSFTLLPAATDDLFAHLKKAGNATRKLESGLKVANLGQKTIRYEDGAQKNEVSFNYSLDPEAQAVADTFEKIAETQRHIFDVERTMRFDKLGVNEALLQLETAWDRKRLLGYERVLPMLDRVAKNDTYLHMARERALKLMDLLKNPPPAKAE